MGSDKRWISIQSYKHDGSLHRYWDRGFLLENNDDYIVVATKRAKVVENNGRRWFTKEPAVTIFSKKEWWNAICMLKKEGVCFYCNIASPSVIEKDLIKYIDYDLDTKLMPNGSIKLLDEKEYLHHKTKYNYSEDLDKVLRYSTDVILSLMNSHSFPFNDSVIEKYFSKFSNMTKKE